MRGSIQVKCVCVFKVFLWEREFGRLEVWGFFERKTCFAKPRQNWSCLCTSLHLICLHLFTDLFLSQACIHRCPWQGSSYSFAIVFIISITSSWWDYVHISCSYLGVYMHANVSPCECGSRTYKKLYCHIAVFIGTHEAVYKIIYKFK